MSVNVCDEVIKKLGFDRIKLVYNAGEQSFDPYDLDDADFKAATDNVRYVRAEVVGCKRSEGDDESEEGVDAVRTPLGYIEAYLYRFGDADEDREEIVCGTADFDGDVHAGAEILYGLWEDFDFRGDCFGDTGLYIQEVYFDPQYRGVGLAEMAMRRFIEWQSNLFAVATVPMTTLYQPKDAKPVSAAEDESSLRIARHRSNEERRAIKASPEQKKLVAWCERIGFKRLEGVHSDFMVLNMNEHRRICWAFKQERKKRARSKARVATHAAS